MLLAFLKNSQKKNPSKKKNQKEKGKLEKFLKFFSRKKTKEENKGKERGIVFSRFLPSGKKENFLLELLF